MTALGPPAARTGAAPRAGVRLPLVVLAAAQFVMVLDSSVMNVSISQIVADLDTTITRVQLATTAYTLSSAGATSSPARRSSSR